ncbi:hypothetical protein VKT23_009379 [Stygiomarasmius scandens]|uniref:Uncharacterized protein n=1 Tax=Marasmiellus scandens TaxID=2682957 RepID=A0ABR1JLD3_9AGAR
MPSNSTNGHYDQSLLAQAAAPTRQQLQEGYQTDLLAPKSSSIPSSRTADRDYESGVAGMAAASSSKEHLANTAVSPRDGPVMAQRRTPFWRSRNGIIALVVAFVVIVAVAVGVGVGVTRNNGNNNAGNSTGDGLESTVPTSTLSDGNSSQPLSKPTLTGTGTEQPTDSSPPSEPTTKIPSGDPGQGVSSGTPAFEALTAIGGTQNP